MSHRGHWRAGDASRCEPRWTRHSARSASTNWPARRRQLADAAIDRLADAPTTAATVVCRTLTSAGVYPLLEEAAAALWHAKADADFREAKRAQDA